jgi:histidinol-phosphate/aromatic aminotransferase/cobyric acid decarboxylase-like protein/N-acyl-L-homoserine lactone synthetase
MNTLPPSETVVSADYSDSSNTSMLRRKSNSRFSVTLATNEDREEIYRIRHDVYASELGQHVENSVGRLQDKLDDYNSYVIVKVAGKILGFVSITPPGKGPYSVDKYFDRDELPIQFHDRLYEIRLLTVLDSHRNRESSLLLIYAAYRWVEAHGGTHVVGIGRREVLQLYQRVGLQVAGPSIQAGAVTYDLMHAEIGRLADRAKAYSNILERIESRTEWELAFPMRKPAVCFHGGAFFDAIGDTFKTLERRESVINADVLDAWFPPAPEVMQVLSEYLPWLLRTSPPTACEGLLRTIAECRHVKEENILPGAGSSDLIFRALRHWLDKNSRVLILDPTYGEYNHVLEQVIGCHVDRFQLNWDEHFTVDLDRLDIALSAGYDLVVLVNPNSPTGQHVARERLEPLLSRVAVQTRVWVDETYVDYVSSEQSLETFAATSENVIVCKSMSKVYALSGARVAYLCAGAHQLEDLRAVTPPWAVSLLAQVAAVKALENPKYYMARCAETRTLREQLAGELSALGWFVLPSVANFLLCELPADGLDASELVTRCREQGLYLRDPGSMGNIPSNRLIRIAVKDADTNLRMVEVIKSARKSFAGIDTNR